MVLQEASCRLPFNLFLEIENVEISRWKLLKNKLCIISPKTTTEDEGPCDKANILCFNSG